MPVVTFFSKPTQWTRARSKTTCLTEKGNRERKKEKITTQGSYSQVILGDKTTAALVQNQQGQLLYNKLSWQRVSGCHIISILNLLSRVFLADGRLVNISGFFRANNAQAPSLFSTVSSRCTKLMVSLCSTFEDLDRKVKSNQCHIRKKDKKRDGTSKVLGTWEEEQILLMRTFYCLPFP